MLLVICILAIILRNVHFQCAYTSKMHDNVANTAVFTSTLVSNFYGIVMQLGMICVCSQDKH